MAKDKSKAGRKLIFQTPEDLQTAIDAYFKRCDETVIMRKHVTGSGVTPVEVKTPYSMAGLAYALDIDRQTLLNYEHRDAFFGIVTRARRKVERQRVEQGLSGCYDTRIAALDLASNHGYTTKQEIKGSGTLKVEVVNYGGAPNCTGESEGETE